MIIRTDGGMRDGSVDIFGPRNQIYNKIYTY